MERLKPAILVRGSRRSLPCDLKLFTHPQYRLNPRHEVIAKTDKLNELVSTLQTAEWVALDTEADSLHAYPERLCLLQLCTVEGDELVDPLAGLDLAGFFAALAGHRIIMHAADYDLRLLRKHHAFVPGAIFDTMLAARLLGVKQFGLGSLVADYLGITLEKTSQKANWAIRPLTERMERYARNDVLHLKALSDRLRADLDAKGRLAWHQEWCARLIQDSAGFGETDPDQVWRVKGSSLLGRPALAVLRELWHWRESEAIAACKPPFFILSHETLVDIAAVAVNGEPVEQKFPRHISDRRRRGLLRAVEQGLAVPSEQWPHLPERKGTRPTESEKRRCFQLERRRDQRAKQLDIDPTLIASRSVLWELARGGEMAVGELMNWQRELLA
jgi:ribonuclease D